MGEIEERGVSKTSFIANLVPEVFCQIIRKIIGRRKYKKKKYCGKEILINGAGNAKIADLLQRGSPFMVGRFGDGELRTVVYYLMRRLGIKKDYPDYIRTAICRNAGFFPNEAEEIDRFGELMLRSVKQCDVLAVWFNLMEEYVFRVFGPKEKTCIGLDELEPFMFDVPWSKYLKGRKILVIHPFSESIENQYAVREKLFTNREILPDFQLVTVKAVQSIGGSSEHFHSWFDALDYMFQESMKLDFDIDIGSLCSAYSIHRNSNGREYGNNRRWRVGVGCSDRGFKGYNTCISGGL